ncbi:MAG: hypothetical protein M1839_000913 [Geoglossum umbratile]|nr:MAG: hypothetical protein M1839_000913 [Geoglossum umbratile]
MEEFRYDPLPINSNTPVIRLVTVVSAFEYTLTQVSLLDRPCYEALSYCWGNPSKRKSIVCNGRTLSITESLYNALRQLQLEHPVLWIDAICIDQSSSAEKGQQVPLMKNIYEAASRVLIWLGPIENHSGLGVIHSLLNAKDAQEAQDDQRSWLVLSEAERKGYGLPGLIQSVTDPAYKAFANLLERAWFTRIWIIQELAVSRDAIVMEGFYQCSWTDFITAVFYAETAKIPPFWKTYVPTMSIRNIEMARQAVKNGESTMLLALLLFYRRSSASNLRDKIYALCGLASDAGLDDLAVQIDYNIQPANLYRQVAIQILSKGRYLDILSVPRVPEPSDVGPLPSWVPDWSISDHSTSLRSATVLWFNFNATSKDEAYTLLQGNNNSVIGLAGEVIDNVSEVGDVYIDYTLGHNTRIQRFKGMARHEAAFNGWEKIARVHSGTKYWPTGEDILDAYWQTLIMGNVGDGYNATKQQFHQWKRLYPARIPNLLNSDWLQWMNLPVGLYVSISGIIISTFGHEYRHGPVVAFSKKLATTLHRRFFKTTKGYIGIGPRSLQKGDAVALFKGGMVPLVIRSLGDKWELVGDCYVHGIMHGEAYSAQRCSVLWIA